MKNKLATYLTFSILVMSFIAKGQDVYFSQIFNNPLYLNPANAGMAEKKNRLVGFYRDQWRSVPVSYASTIFSYDRNLFEKNTHRLGTGIHFFYDKAGDGALSTLKFDISGAYGKYLNSDKQLLTVGFQAGFAQRSVDLSKLSFGSQIDGFEIDPSIESGESFSSKLSVADMALGIGFKTKIRGKSSLDLGWTIFNLIDPNNSFSEVNRQDRDYRFGLYVMGDAHINEQWSLKPAYYFQNQNVSRQYLVQLLAAHQFKNTKKPIELSFGGLYRVKDAAIAYAGVEFKDLLLGISYDINTSSFSDATNRNGALEVSLRYQFERKKEEGPIVLSPIDEAIEEKVLQEEMEEYELNEEVLEEEFEEEESIVPIEFQGVKEEVIVSIERMRERLPVKIYFENDQPDPGSTNTTTNANYKRLFQNYDSKIDDYKSQFRREDDKLNTFYQNTVDKGWENLQLFVDELNTVLADGHYIELVIQGYASSIGSKEYNANLSKRRISSVKNYLLNAKGGELSNYFNNGQLKVTERPFGEIEATDEFNEEWKYLGKNVFNPAQAFERRVEIRAVEFEKR